MDKVSFGYEDVAPDEKTRRVGGVFSNVAASYDLMNDLMSGGMHRHWKNQFVRRLRPRQGEAILDMAGGTGDIAFRLARSGAAIKVADINPAMLEVGMERAGKRGIDGLTWIEQNAETLSFEDNRFDAYTIAFGIRNVTHIDKALAEAHRVLRPGGRLILMEPNDRSVPLRTILRHGRDPRFLFSVALWRPYSRRHGRFSADRLRATLERSGFVGFGSEEVLAGLGLVGFAERA